MVETTVILNDLGSSSVVLNGLTWNDLSVSDASITISSYNNDGAGIEVNASEPLAVSATFTYGSSLDREPVYYLRHNSDKFMIKWRWYQPIKNWLKFNLKVLLS